MDNRLELQAKLEAVIGNKNVYFQPPASIKLTYPCVIYSIGNGEAKRANDKLYMYTHNYEVLFICKKPTISMIERMMNEFQMCNMTRTYTSDNLHHYVFNIYF